MPTLASILAGMAILVGLAGIVVPVLPGLLLVWAAVLGWTLVVEADAAWWVLLIATLFLAAGWWAQYLLPGRRLRTAGIPRRTSAIALVAGLVGAVIVPVVGLPLFFVLAVYLLELARLGRDDAWPSTVHAVKAAALSYGIEFTTGLAIALAWIVGVIRVATLS